MIPSPVRSMLLKDLSTMLPRSLAHQGGQEAPVEKETNLHILARHQQGDFLNIGPCEKPMKNRGHYGTVER